jgi:hypothetical protein
MPKRANGTELARIETGCAVRCAVVQLSFSGGRVDMATRSEWRRAKLSSKQVGTYRERIGTRRSNRPHGVTHRAKGQSPPSDNFRAERHFGETQPLRTLTSGSRRALQHSCGSSVAANARRSRDLEPARCFEPGRGVMIMLCGLEIVRKRLRLSMTEAVVTAPDSPPTMPSVPTS